MNIGIIGSGNIGKTLAKQFVSLGHRVSIANSRGPQSLVVLATETCAIPVTVEQVVRDKDIVVIAIPQESILNLPKILFSQADAKTIVVDTCNYYPEVRDIQIPEIEEGLTESEWVSNQLGVPIIKAFNNITVGSLRARELPSATTGRICLPVAGDISKDKQVIVELISDLGFDVLDAGLLADSWRQQPGTPAYCTDLDVEDLTAALAKAERSKIPQYRLNALSSIRRAIAENGSLTAAAANAGRT